MKFINLSNRPTTSWNENQLKAACELVDHCEIFDIGFQIVNPNADANDVTNYALSRLSDIIDTYGRNIIIHVMGEVGFVFAFVTEAKKQNITCVYSVIKQMDKKYFGRKIFEFLRFRSY